MPEHQHTHQSKESNPTFQKQATPIIQTPISNPDSIIQRARINPKSLTSADILQLQRTIGNRAVGRLLSDIGVIPSKAIEAPPVQRQEIPEEEEPLQKKRENNTGMPDNLKAGVESLSGIDMSDVRVHYNSSKPDEVGALAYTQGTNIHVAPGQERHLPHEAWHVVQQAQGRVKPMMYMKSGVPVNDDKGLEHEADVMGERAVQESIDNDLRNGVKHNEVLLKRSHQNSLDRLSESIVQRYDLVPGTGLEDSVNGSNPEEKLDGVSDISPYKRRYEEEDREDISEEKLDGVFDISPYKRRHEEEDREDILEEPIQSKRGSCQLVLSQKEDSAKRIEKDQSNFWARISSPDHEVPFWGRATNNNENSYLVMQRVISTRYGGKKHVNIAGVQKGGGWHPPVPTNAWQQKTVKGQNYKFWNEGDGTLEFTAPTMVGAGPALQSKHTVNIDAGNGIMKITGRSLKNSREQHNLVANIYYKGWLPNQKGKYTQPNRFDSPPGLTWHHHKDKGKMELLDRDVHGAFLHHGGFSIWGS